MDYRTRWSGRSGRDSTAFRPRPEPEITGRHSVGFLFSVLRGTKVRGGLIHALPRLRRLPLAVAPGLCDPTEAGGFEWKTEVALGYRLLRERLVWLLPALGAGRTVASARSLKAPTLISETINSRKPESMAS